ncbi:hypothetical protein P3G55_20015 [Leptospira sp. 96542]|nr:hypothetical protein [Leptospira sp. 96542]
MKPSIFLANGLILSICFFPYCSSLQTQYGSISRQLDLIEDLEEKLPEKDRPRFRKALTNIRAEEQGKDNTISEYKTEAKESTQQTIQTKEDSGKWYGVRNVSIFLGVCFVAFFGLKIAKII